MTQKLKENKSLINHINEKDFLEITKKINQLIHASINNEETQVILAFKNPDLNAFEQIIKNLAAARYGVLTLSEQYEDNITFYLKISWKLQTQGEE